MLYQKEALLTRKKFLALCHSADREIDGESVQLSIGVCRDGLDRVVVLYGAWCGGTVPSRELYRPSPGRQGIDCYRTADRKCGLAIDKFQRWLDFYCGFCRGYITSGGVT